MGSVIPAPITLKRLRSDPGIHHVGSVAKTFILEESFALSNSAYSNKSSLVHINLLEPEFYI